MNASEPRKVVVDANVLIHSRGQFPFQKAFIPPSVKEEVGEEISRDSIQMADHAERNTVKKEDIEMATQ